MSERIVPAPAPTPRAQGVATVLPVPVEVELVGKERKTKTKTETAQHGVAVAPYKGFVAGVFSGLMKLTVGHPFDTLKVRLQTAPPSQFAGPLDCLRKTVGKEGFRALYKGATPPLIGWMFMDSIMLGSMTNYRNFLRRYYYEPRHSLPPSAPLPHVGCAIAGIGGGWTVSFVAAPIEHIKARLQVQYHDARRHYHHHHHKLAPTTTKPISTTPQHPQYSGPIACVRSIFVNHGIRGIFHGLFATLVFRSHFAVMWFSYSHLTEQFKRHTTLSDPAINFWAGGLGAQCYWLTSYPFDVVKQRITTDRLVGAREAVGRERGTLSKILSGKEGYAGGEKYGRSWAAAARGVYWEGNAGIKGFWRGFTPCFLRAFPVNAMALVTFEGVMRWLP